jgi:hypothetical protein
VGVKEMLGFKKKEKNLIFTGLKVQLIYGFKTEPVDNKKWKEWFSEKLLNGTVRRRAGWTPIYRYLGGPSAVLQFDGFADERSFKLHPPKEWEGLGCVPYNTISGSLEKFVTIRRDGLGALTLVFTLSNNESKYKVHDLLAMLLVAPRTLCGYTSTSEGTMRPILELARLKIEPDLPKKVTNKLNLPLKKNIDDGKQIYSSAFRCYLEGMSELLLYIKDEEDKDILSWNVKRELELDDLNQAANNTKNEPPDSDKKGLKVLDVQVPYMCVFATTPLDIYEKAFLERGNDFEKKRVARKAYSKQIAAILGRWLFEKNIPFASADYWESEGTVKDGVFRSTYMNSIVFTVFSGMVALSILPDLDNAHHLSDFNKKAMRLPFDPTCQSILRCLEFSRTRWHHVISLNRDIDELIKALDLCSGTSQVLEFKNKLLVLRSGTAIHFQDPLSYLWDATVGSKIAKFLHASIINSLEESTTKKLEMLDKLIEDRTAIAKIEDFNRAICASKMDE